jgi:hypothetical protein
MLQEFGPEIWIADGPVVSFYGFPYPTRMVVIRLAEGRLFVWSPIPLDGVRADVEALGTVTCLVSPNLLHHFWLGEWKQAYPGVRMIASAGLCARRRDLTFDGELGDAPDPEWADDIDQVAVRGNVFMTETVFLHRASRTAIFADLIENFPPDWFKGWRGFVARLDGIVHPNCGPPRELRWGFWARGRARVAVQRVLEFAPERVVVAHGMVAATDGADFVRRAFRWLF